MDLLEAIRTFFSCREFAEKPVPDGVISRMLGAVPREYGCNGRDDREGGLGAVEPRAPDDARGSTPSSWSSTLNPHDHQVVRYGPSPGESGLSAQLLGYLDLTKILGCDRLASEHQLSVPEIAAFAVLFMHQLSKYGRSSWSISPQPEAHTARTASGTAR